MRKPVAAALIVCLSSLLSTGLAAQGTPAAEPGQPTPAARQPGKPANLCQELVAYLKRPSPNAGPKSDPSLTTAVQAPKSNEQPPQPSGTGAPSQSGISGPISNHVSQGAPGPQGATQKTAEPKGAPPATTKPGQVDLADAERMAAGNDFAACREATQRLRLAGAPLPPDLLALGALDLKFFDAGAL
jgi:hypothetical protein